MSLADGLARALQKYVHAKGERGMRALLLGESGPLTAETERRNGNGNGNGNGNVAGSGAKEKSSRARVPSRFEALGIQWQQTQYKVLCPDCQNPLHFGEGCATCDSCGFSKC